MGNGLILTKAGKKAILHLAFEAATSYAIPTRFLVGKGTTTPAATDTQLSSVVARALNVNTSTSAFKLIDSGAGFVSSGVAIGDWVKNISDSLWATVTSVDSEQQLTLSVDIFTSSPKSYGVAFSKAVATGYPVFDDTNLVQSSRCILLTTECNSNTLTEFGLVSVGTLPTLFSRMVFTGIAKSSSIQLIFVEKDRVS